jgi:hypothetical protein
VKKTGKEGEEDGQAAKETTCQAGEEGQEGHKEK